MKHEIKIDFKENEILKDFLVKSYKEGRIFDKAQRLSFDSDTQVYHLCKGLSNFICKIINDDIIDGALRLIIIEEEDTIHLYPCSILYEMDNDRYSFLN